jgi:hypothetical protein
MSHVTETLPEGIAPIGGGGGVNSDSASQEIAALLRNSDVSRPCLQQFTESLSGLLECGHAPTIRFKCHSDVLCLKLLYRCVIMTVTQVVESSLESSYVSVCPFYPGEFCGTFWML